MIAYFPAGYWYNLFSYQLDIEAPAVGKVAKLHTPLTDIQVHVHGGHILPLQESARTTTLSRQSPFTLLVALCPGYGAEGELFWDDGEQVAIKHYLNVSYEAKTTLATSSSSSSATLGIHDSSQDKGLHGQVKNTILHNTFAAATDFKINHIKILSKGSQYFKNNVITGSLAIFTSPSKGGGATSATSASTAIVTGTITTLQNTQIIEFHNLNLPLSHTFVLSYNKNKEQ